MEELSMEKELAREKKWALWRGSVWGK